MEPVLSSAIELGGERSSKTNERIIEKIIDKITVGSNGCFKIESGK